MTTEERRRERERFADLQRKALVDTATRTGAG